MKKLYTLFSIMIAVVTFAQAPQGFNYQATVRNSAGVLIVNQNVNFKFNIMLNSQTSVPIYSENHFAPTDDLGQVNLAIGQGTATVGTFSSINWANGSYYLGIEINTGSGYVAMGTTQLLSVPYALYANSSGNSNFNFPNGTNIGDTLNWIWNGSAWVPTSSVSNAQLPVISTIVATNTLTPSPSSGGTITSDGGYSITSKGVCWSASPNPTISNNSTNNGTGASNFTSILSNLLPSTTYYYRAYATISIGTGYGITYTFTTASNPQLTTSVISSVTSSTASSGGTISSDGGATITAKGVCWSTSPNPTVALTTKTNNGTGTATFTSSITSLLPLTTYYVKAYATNSFGTAYGQEEVFTTLSTLPTLTTTVASVITSTTASSGGTISSDGGATITARGIVWSIATNPTTTTNQGLTSDGNGIGTFTSSIIQLTPGTIYYVRAYATNSGGTAYGNQITFSALPILPNISTTTISSVTSSTASSGGTISSSGGATITAKGVCWSTSPNPTIALTTKTNNGTGTATFTSSITGLLPITTYYVKAYATNSAGTAYGQEEVFTTLATLPTLTTTAVSAITSVTASSGGAISNDGGATITARGIVWSTATNPTTTTNQGITSNGTGIGTFTSSISQLTPGTLYYVRAYATNSGGTAYGNQITFSALPILPNISTTTISAITRNTASSGGTISTDGGATITAKGVCWSTSPNPTIALTTKTNDGTGTATFTSSITGLLPTTTYYVRAYATNSVGTSYGNEINFISATLLTIGTQIWSPDNSDVTSYRDGTPIPQVSSSAWGSLQTGAWCYYNIDPVIGATYGKLYNWYAIMGIYDTASLTNPSLRKQFAPVGWHIPTDTEWTTLTTFLGGVSIAGGSLKETGVLHWLSPNPGATNTSGFTALPGGFRSSQNQNPFYSIYEDGLWWTSSEIDTPSAWARQVRTYGADIYRIGQVKTSGFSVRLIKD